ncbi:ATP-grasp domain-containing protein [Pseudoalteromonas umbrosa]|uniref:ATP-grasp domain-containing protein n=1 Tax=Pseudoalteromonas umbrosa TaxID=3048489 RepID=UPI0024C39A08|nr:sugar-transfer associated ATP-grasp domain-containing protein [Pseudoalteromonas sp. B95]MDK1289688.1 sugar-transfer associated ATP-grasp domain-containing protein [Pseudoalteromonas sp. B95]
MTAVSRAPHVGIWMYENGGGKEIEQQLVHALAERGILASTGLNLRDARARDGGIECNGVAMEQLDAFLSYNAGQQTQYQLYLYETLNETIPTLNNYRAFALAEDKFRTSHLLNSHGIYTPDYRLCHKNDMDGLRAALHDFGGKLVYKPTDGWGGVGIVKIEGEQALDMIMPFLSRTDLRYFYVERFINYDNTDYRVDIVDGQFVGCYGRKAPKDDWKTNVTSGGSVFVREANDEVVELALKATKALGLEIAGVDLIYDREKEQYVVLEVNTIPAFATPEQEQLGLTFNQAKIQAMVGLIEKTVLNKTSFQSAKVA